MPDAPKSSTFVIHHDRCDPAKWTPADVLALASFVRGGSLIHAAHLARLGLQLVASEHHVPAGGTLQPIGWCRPDEAGSGPYEDLTELADSGDDIVEVVQVYRGPVEYAVPVAVNDADGSGWDIEIEVKPTEAEARAFLDRLQQAAADPAGEDRADG